MSSITMSDVSAKGRIVAAAIDLFGERGFRATTVREIARRADVSAALVIHHFGGKDGLRRECDDRVIGFVADKQQADASAAAVLSDAAGRYGPYLARILADRSDAADDLFDRLLVTSRATLEAGIRSGALRPGPDRDAQAAALVVVGLAPFFVAAQLARWSGGDAETGIARIANPLADIYAHGLGPAGHLEETS